MSKKNTTSRPEGPKQIQNRKAGFDYEIIDRFEAGIVLVGSEVKSLYGGHANLVDAYCEVKNGELFLINMEIQPYTHSSTFSPETRRTRKLLMHKREIATLQRKAQEKGFTLLATRVYFKNGRVKVEIGLGRGKKDYDKRHALAEKEERRDKQRVRNNDF